MYKPFQAPMHPLIATSPFEQVVVDILGPLPTTEAGNKFVLLFMDVFTKWPEGVALPEVTASIVMDCFWAEVVSRHGVPRILSSDNGSQFRAKLVQDVCELLRIKKRYSTTYSPTSQGNVERMNKTLAERMAFFANAQQSDWDILLPTMLFSYRTAIQAAISDSPFRLVYGRDCVLPVDVRMNVRDVEYIDQLDYKSQLALNITSIWHHASQQNRKADQTRALEYDKKLRVANFQIGDLVLVKKENPPQGLSRKLYPFRYTGPWRILAIHNTYHYEVQNLSDLSEVVRINVRRLKPFVGNYQLG